MAMMKCFFCGEKCKRKVHNQKYCPDCATAGAGQYLYRARNPDVARQQYLKRSPETRERLNKRSRSRRAAERKMRFESRTFKCGRCGEEFRPASRRGQSQKYCLTCRPIQKKEAMRQWLSVNSERLRRKRFLNRRRINEHRREVRTKYYSREKAYRRKYVARIAEKARLWDIFLETTGANT